MEKVAYIILLIFWASIFIIFVKPVDDLRGKAEYYSYYFKDRALDTKLAKKYFHILSEGKKKKLLTELMEGLSYLKNITILGRAENISAEYMLEELSDFSPGLSKTYLDMARSISTNEKYLAKDALYIATGSSYARDIGDFLTSWEDIPQNELLSSIEAYLNVMREEQITKQQTKDELVSDLVYLPVVINCMLVLLNFIFVSYFLEQEESLAQLFSL